MKKTFIVSTSVFILLLLQLVGIVPFSTAITLSGSDISPTIFSPGDGNGLNDTTTITVTYTSGETLYVNIFNDQSKLEAANRVMSENPSGTYKYTWNGKNDSNDYVNEGVYTIRISDNPAEDGTTIGTVEVDTTPPSSPSLSIESGNEYTNSRNVTLDIGATDAIKMKISNLENFSGATWETYSTSKTWQLTEGDGVKTVYINFRDTAGANVSTYDTITLDTGLTNPTLSINGGNSSTNNRAVTLTITAPDATYMKIDNDTNFYNMSNWIAKATTYQFTLPSGDGSKTVYLRVRDNANNQATTSDSIKLDTQPPTNLSILINGGASYTNSRQVVLTLSASGGPSRMYISNDGNTWTGYDYATSKSWNLSTGDDGQRIVYYKAADSSGNNATAVTATIQLDTTAPSPVTLSSPTEGATVDTQTPQFTWTDPNSDTARYYIQILRSGNSVQASYVNTTNYNASTLDNNMAYTWKVTVYDRANNSVTTSERSFTISITGLAAPVPTYPVDGAYINDSAPYMPRLRWSQVSDATRYNIRYGLSESELNYQGNSTLLYYDIGTPSLSQGDTVYWKVKAVNSTSQSIFSSVRSFTIDSQAPTDLSISIEGGSVYTASTSVTLTLSATGASKMMISNYANFSGASWETYTTSKSWTLTSTDGTKTVYFKAKDNAVGDNGDSNYANVADAINDTIILDTTAPIISSPFPTGTITNTEPEISADLTDGSGSGVKSSSVTLMVDGVNQTSNATIDNSSVSYTPSSALDIGTHTVNITAQDNLGNTDYLQWTFTIQTSGSGGEPPGGGPTGGNIITISNVVHTPTTVTNADAVNVSATITATNGIYKARLYYSYDDISDSIVMNHSGNNYYGVIGPFHEGATVTYYIHVTDNEAATEESSNVTFIVQDSNAPIITIILPIDGSTITDRTPTIEISYSDPGGIDISSVILTLDGTDITENATVTMTSVTYIPLDDLSYSEHEVTISVADISGNTNTKTWSFTIQAETVEIIETVKEILEGKNETIDFKEYKTSLDEITITAANNLENLIITCTTTGEKPEDVTEPTEMIYMYLILETNTEASNISSAIISFKVEKSWFEDNNIDTTSVKLMRYNDGWIELETTKVTEDDTYIYYKATTSGFSVFAVAASEIVSSPSGLSWEYILVIALVIIVISIIAFIYYQKKFY